MKNFSKENYIVLDGKFKGMIGKIELGLPGEKYGNVMFYPIEGKKPYRFCLKKNLIKEIEKI